MSQSEQIRIIRLGQPTRASTDEDWAHHAESIRNIVRDVDISLAPEGTTLESAESEAFLLLVCDADGLEAAARAPAAIRARCVIATLEEATDEDTMGQVRFVAKAGFAGGYLGVISPRSRRALMKFVGRADLLKDALQAEGRAVEMIQEAIDGYCYVAVLRTSIIEYLKRVRSVIGEGWNRLALPPYAERGE